MKRLLYFIMVAGLIGSFVLPVSVAHADDSRCLGADLPGCSFGLPTDVYNKLLAEMQAFPAPTLPQIDIDTKEVYRYTFYRIQTGAEIFDRPNGSIIGTTGEGFNFVSIYGQQDGFAMMKDKTWLRKSALKQVTASTFGGVRIDKPTPYPVAWIIQASIPSQYPGGPRSKKTPAINRYKMVNIYATIKVEGWDWYLVGPGQWLEQRKVARIKQAINPGAQKWIAVDLFEQVLSAYEGDRMVFATLISSGLTQWQTNIGSFKVWRKMATTPMSGAMGQPDFYSLPAVPYVMYFDNDISLHGTYWHDGFGFKHSHGCVNMTISDARWLYNWSGDAEGVPVIVWDSRSSS